MLDPEGFNRRLVTAAFRTIPDIDVGVILYDVTQHWGGIQNGIAEALQKRKCPTIVALTKIDLLNSKEELLPLIQNTKAITNIENIIPLCAPKKQGLNELLDALYDLLPVGPQYFDEDTVTDQPERVIVAEIIRETLFYTTRQEVPYASAVEIEEFRDAIENENSASREKAKSNRIFIRACIFVERDSQKGIIIGKHGGMLKKIGSKARTHIERFLGTQVYLELVVKVAPKWRNDEDRKSVV